MKKVGHIEYYKPSLFKPMEYIVTYQSDEKGGAFKAGCSRAYVTHSHDSARIMSMLAMIAEKLKIDLEMKWEGHE